MQVPVNILGPSYESHSLSVDAQRSINLFAEMDEGQGGKSVGMLARTAGLIARLTLPKSPIRAMANCGDRLFALAGNTFYEVTKSGSAWAHSTIGTVATSSGRASIVYDGLNVIVSAGWRYAYNIDSKAWTELSEAPTGTEADGVDGYTVYVEAGTGKFWYGEYQKPGDVDGLNFATAEAYPDNLVGIVVLQRKVVLLGATSIEEWYNTGGSDNLFERIEGSVRDRGCAAAGSIARIDNTAFFLGSGDEGVGMVWRLTDGAPQRISTHAVERALRQSTDLSAATAFVWEEFGHTFYQITAPGLASSWVYDVSAGLWHERAYWNTRAGAYERHRAEIHAFWGGVHLVSDYQTGAIYETSFNAFDDAGNPQRWLRRTAYSDAQLRRFAVHSFQVDLETGVGLDGNGQGANPVLYLRYSDDGGRTWSQLRPASMGKIGQYRMRAIWRRLGQSRNRIWEVSGSDPVKTVIVRAFADITLGAD